MSQKQFLVDLTQLDFDNPIAEIDDIRDFNPQRFEMEHLTAVVHQDLENKTCVGYLDVTDHEFWIRGHMPGFPLMPGVIMLESVAQLCSYFVHRNNLLGENVLVGFGGVDDVRFRGPVLPGQRLILMAQLTRIRPGRMLTCGFQGVVENRLILDGSLKGIPLPVEELRRPADSSRVADSANLASN